MFHGQIVKYTSNSAISNVSSSISNLAEICKKSNANNDEILNPAADHGNNNINVVSDEGLEVTDASSNLFCEQEITIETIKNEVLPVKPKRISTGRGIRTPWQYSRSQLYYGILKDTDVYPYQIIGLIKFWMIEIVY